MLYGLQFSLVIMALIFLSISLGGLTAIFANIVLKRSYEYLLLFCGGVLAGLLVFDVIPETFYTYNSTGIFIGVFLGVILMLLIDNTLHEVNDANFEKPDIFLLLFIALLLHSIPTGIALGMSYQNEHLQNPSLLLTIVLHHLPEGMTIMIAVILSNVKTHIFWLLAFLLSCTIMISTLIGFSINSESLKLYTLFLGAAIGTLSYVTYYEILWKQMMNKFTLKLITVALLGLFSFYILHISGFAH